MNGKSLKVCLLLVYSQTVVGQKPTFLIDPCPPHTISINCDERKVAEGQGFGQLINGKRQGLWQESYRGKPYARGNYMNGKREGQWTFYWIEAKHLGKDTIIEMNVQKFAKAKIYCQATFEQGKLHGEYRRFIEGRLNMVANYRNDSLVDTLRNFDTKGRLIYVANYNKTYYDTTWLNLWGEYLDARLPYSIYFQYSGRNNYFRFEGYKNNDEYLIYNNKEKNYQKERTILDFYFNEKAEGKYQMFYKGKVTEEFDIKEGRKIRTAKRNVE